MDGQPTTLPREPLFLTNDPTSLGPRMPSTKPTKKPSCLKSPETAKGLQASTKTVTFPGEEYIATCIKTGLPLSINDECHLLEPEYEDSDDEAEKLSTITMRCSLELENVPNSTVANEPTAQQFEDEVIHNIQVENELEKAEKWTELHERQAIMSGWMDFALHVKTSPGPRQKLVGILRYHRQCLVGSYQGTEKKHAPEKDDRVVYVRVSRYSDWESSMSAIEDGDGRFNYQNFEPVDSDDEYEEIQGQEMDEEMMDGIQGWISKVKDVGDKTVWYAM